MTLIVIASVIRASLYVLAAAYCSNLRVWDLAVLAMMASVLTMAIALLGPWAGVLAVPYAGFYARTFVVYASRMSYRHER